MTGQDAKQEYFTKIEIVLKDFMREMISKDGYLTNDFAKIDAEKIAQQAAIFTEAYFNELNKQA